MNDQRTDEMIAGQVEPTPACCPVWPTIKESFDWYRRPVGLRVMPHIQVGGGREARVNFCPACGAPRRDCVERTDV